MNGLNGPLISHIILGVLMGDIMGRIKGEIMVFTLVNKKLRICARISNKPWDAIGCWYGNKYVISSEFKWLAHMVSTTMLLVNKVRCYVMLPHMNALIKNVIKYSLYTYFHIYVYLTFILE